MELASYDRKMNILAIKCLLNQQNRRIRNEFIIVIYLKWVIIAGVKNIWIGSVLCIK